MLESKWAHPLDFSKRISVRWLWLGSSAIWLIGLVCSIVFADDFFSRSGAVVIAILLLLLVLDARKDPDAWESFASRLVQRSDDGEELHIPSSAVRAFYDQEFKARSFVRHEGYVAALSTLIWGFGDLIVQPLYEVL